MIILNKYKVKNVIINKEKINSALLNNNDIIKNIKIINEKYLTFETEEPENTIQINRNDSNGTELFEYKLNDEEWKDYTFTDLIGLPIDLINPGDKVRFRAKNKNSKINTYSHKNTFVTYKKCKCYGNIMSLLSKEPNDNQLIDGWSFSRFI